VLIIFDRLFGTYRAERDDLPCRYGLVHPLQTYNFAQIEFSQWRSLAHDLLAARSVRAFLGYLLMPPGWQPDGQGATTEALRRRHAANGAASRDHGSDDATKPDADTAINRGVRPVADG
jgi:hypothetical protein